MSETTLIGNEKVRKLAVSMLESSSIFREVLKN